MTTEVGSKAKRYSAEEDRFIVSYFDAMGDFIGPHDLGRPEGSAAKRAAKLKRSGAWERIKREMTGEARSEVRTLGADRPAVTKGSQPRSSSPHLLTGENEERMR